MALVTSLGCAGILRFVVRGQYVPSALRTLLGRPLNEFLFLLVCQRIIRIIGSLVVVWMLLSRLLVLPTTVRHGATHSRVTTSLHVRDVVTPLFARKQLVSLLLNHLTLSVAATGWAGVFVGGNSAATSQSHGQLVIAAILGDQLAIRRVKTGRVPSLFVIA